MEGTGMTPNNGADLRQVRDDVLDQLRRTLADDALTDPSPAEVEQVRTIIAERVARANREAAARGEPPLREPDLLVQRLLDEIVGLGPLASRLCHRERPEALDGHCPSRRRVPPAPRPPGDRPRGAPAR
jgi:hypothetical protein